MGRERLLAIAAVLRKYLLEQPPARMPGLLHLKAFARLNQIKSYPRQEIIRRLSTLYADAHDVLWKTINKAHDRECCRLRELRNVWLFNK